MKIWTGCSNTIPLEHISPPAGTSWATELFHGPPAQLGVPALQPGWQWDTGVPAEVSVARFEEVRNAALLPREVESGERVVETSGPSAQLAANLEPVRGTAQTLWKEASTTLQLERSALSPAPQDPVDPKFRVWLQPMEEKPARGLDGASWKDYPLDPLADPGSLMARLALSEQAADTFPPGSENLGVAGLPSKPAGPIHSAAQIEPSGVALTLYPAFRRLPNPILTAAD